MAQLKDLIVNGNTRLLNTLYCADLVADGAAKISFSYTHGLKVNTTSSKSGSWSEGIYVVDNPTGYGTITIGLEDKSDLFAFVHNGSTHKYYLETMISGNGPYQLHIPQSKSGTLCTTDGYGASGTWGISISGNAATATSATSATTATKLGTDAGGSTTPVYFSGGKPVACTAYSSASVNYATSAGSATSASTAGASSLIIPSNSSCTYSASTWEGAISSGTKIWGEAFGLSSLGTDTGDLVFRLTSDSRAGGVGLNICIDGYYYSMGTKVSLEGHSHAWSEITSKNSETWTFTLSDGSTTTRSVTLT